MSVRGYRHGVIISFFNKKTLIIAKKHFLSPKNTFYRQKTLFIARKHFSSPKIRFYRPGDIKKRNYSTMAVTSNTHLYRRGGIDEFKKKFLLSIYIAMVVFSNVRD